jgi:hypothetical protein
MAKKQQQEDLPREEMRTEEPQVEEQEVEEQEEEQPERLNRRECAQRVIAEVDGDTTLTELAEKADALYMAGRDAEPDPDTAAWYIQKILETLEGVGLVELRWECVIHPNVPKLGLPSKNVK